MPWSAINLPRGCARVVVDCTLKPLKTPKGTARHGITRPLPTRLNLRRPGPTQEQSPKVGVLIVQKLVTFWMLVGLSSRKVLMKERA